MTLAGKRIFITGGSRGIGLAIALRAAKDGALIAIAAKTTEPHPKLPGTIFTAAKDIEDAGGKALAIACDIRDENQIAAAVEQAAEALKLTAKDMKRMKLVDEIVKEPLGGAHKDREQTFITVSNTIVKSYNEFKNLSCI